MSVTLHTDVGDIKVELYCEQCPKACENFLALCASNYYNGSLFHRNIKGFIVQTGDPTGTGKGGTSIWGRKFEDEFKEELKHNARGMVSMANNGPNSNGSQFFFTYGEQPHLDLKYTLFGRKTKSNMHQYKVKSPSGCIRLSNLIHLQPRLQGSSLLPVADHKIEATIDWRCLNNIQLLHYMGKIIDGFEALDDLEKMAVNPKTFRPLTEAKITSVTIHANPLAG